MKPKITLLKRGPKKLLSSKISLQTREERFARLQNLIQHLRAQVQVVVFSVEVQRSLRAQTQAVVFTVEVRLSRGAQRQPMAGILFKAGAGDEEYLNSLAAEELRDFLDGVILFEVNSHLTSLIIILNYLILRNLMSRMKRQC